MKEQDIIILKIGVSSITDKANEETLNHEALEWFAKLIASSVDTSFLSSDCLYNKESYNGKSKPQFIVVHGAGSFGHHSAKRYGLRCGKAAFLEESNNLDHPDNTAKIPKIVSLACEAHFGLKIYPNENVFSSKKQRYQMEGLSKTRYSVQKLNAAVMNSLIKHGVNAVGVSPGMTVHSLRAHGAT